MSFQSGLSRVAFEAMRAPEWLYARVGKNVPFQMLFNSESSATKLTFKGFLSGVLKHNVRL